MFLSNFNALESIPIELVEEGRSYGSLPTHPFSGANALLLLVSGFRFIFSQFFGSKQTHRTQSSNELAAEFSMVVFGSLSNGGIGGIVHPPIGRKNTTYIPLIVYCLLGGYMGTRNNHWLIGTLMSWLIKIPI